jgi:hypothetical protein
MAQDHEKKETKPDEELDTEEYLVPVFEYGYGDAMRLNGLHWDNGSTVAFIEHVKDMPIEELKQMTIELFRDFMTVHDWVYSLTTSEFWGALENVILRTDKPDFSESAD